MTTTMFETEGGAFIIYCLLKIARFVKFNTFFHPKWDFEQAKWNSEQSRVPAIKVKL